ncbi:hypothetical protein L1987_63467 [Smallanthus sonchifolius]|uniref:Uncharacterized protein n=1 Tax=Smallanthus sonchifolius TaxID=185202 RepID=A0ACB9CD99_9ASTR|nr:hypothetical protein L1987_63467 [Smallanthus sonchifolius]
MSTTVGARADKQAPKEALDGGDVVVDSGFDTKLYTVCVPEVHKIDVNEGVNMDGNESGNQNVNEVLESKQDVNDVHDVENGSEVETNQLKLDNQNEDDNEDEVDLMEDEANILEDVLLMLQYVSQFTVCHFIKRLVR